MRLRAGVSKSGGRHRPAGPGAAEGEERPRASKFR